MVTTWKYCKTCGAKFATKHPEPDFQCVRCKHPDTEPYFEYPDFDVPSLEEASDDEEYDPDQEW